MTIAFTRHYAALSALLFPCFTGLGALAAERVETPATATIVQPVAVTVVNNTPLQAQLLTTAIAPVGVVFTTSNSGSVTVGASGGAGTGGAAARGGGAAGGSSGGAAGASGAGVSGGDDGGAGFVAFGGSINGTTINGDAVSVSVGSMSGGSANGSGQVPVIIAQYN